MRSSISIEGPNNGFKSGVDVATAADGAAKSPCVGLPISDCVVGKTRYSTNEFLWSTTHKAASATTHI